MITYHDLAIFYEIESTGYANSKQIINSGEVDCVFIENLGFLHAENQEALNSDGVLYVDPENTFVMNNRLEGMLVTVKGLWFKVISVTVNRDHLLENKIDNIECLLKKSSSLQKGGNS